MGGAGSPQRGRGIADRGVPLPGTGEGFRAYSAETEAPPGPLRRAGGGVLHGYLFRRKASPKESTWPVFRMRTTTRKRAPLAEDQPPVDRLKT